MVPFGLRMLRAELPQYLGKSEETITMLARLLAKVNTIIRAHIEANDESKYSFIGGENVFEFKKFVFSKRSTKNLARTKTQNPILNCEHSNQS